MKKKLRKKKLKKQSNLIVEHNIKGAFCVKRAVEVALTGRHSIAFVGAKGCGKTVFRNFISKLNSDLIMYESRLCPCGNYGNKIRPCSCNVAQIKRFRKKKSFQKCLSADIVIECIQPREKELADKCSWNFELKTVEEYQKSWKLDKTAEELLAAAVKYFGLDMHQRKIVCEVAGTIAFMDSELVIKSQHIAEAIQYQAFER